MSRKVIPVSVQLAKGNPNRLTKTEIEGWVLVFRGATFSNVSKTTNTNKKRGQMTIYKALSVEIAIFQ